MTGEEKLQQVLGRLQTPRRSGGAYSAPCPAHPDKHPSLRVTLGDNGHVLFLCNKGCTKEEIEAALVTAGVPASVFDGPGERTGTQRTPLREHVYEGPNGMPVAVKVKWRGRGARYSWRRPDGASGLNGLDPGLYRRTEVDAAVLAGDVVWLVEGERDADTLAVVGLTATTGPHGAATWRPAWTAVLAGAAVVVIADRDRKGVNHARVVAAELAGAGCMVTTMVPPPPAKDVTDLLEAGGTVDDLMPLTDDIDVGAPVIRLTKDGRPAFAQIPHNWAEQFDGHCLRIVVLLDADQGDDGLPMRGRNKLAERLKMSRETASEHLDHLIGHEVVVKTRRGRGQEEYRVVNPSRRHLADRNRTGSRPLPDRQPVRSDADSGPAARPLPRSSGVNKFLDVGEVSEETGVFP